MSAYMKLEGFSELEDELDNLSQSAGKGVLRRSLRKSATPMAEKMAAGASRDEGDLSESVGVSTKLSKRQRKLHRKTVRDDKASVEIFVGAGPLPQAHLEEFGSINQAPHPFVRPAWDSDKKDLVDRLGKELWAEMEKTIKRAEARAAKTRI